MTRNIALPVSRFSGLQSVALGGDERPEHGFLGPNAVGWMPLAGEVWDFTALDGYDTPIKDGYLNDVVAGDLTGNGRKDLVFLETAKNYLDLVRFDSHHKLVPGGPLAGLRGSTPSVARPTPCPNRAKPS